MSTFLTSDLVVIRVILSHGPFSVAASIPGLRTEPDSVFIARARSFLSNIESPDPDDSCVKTGLTATGTKFYVEDAHDLTAVVTMRFPVVESSPQVRGFTLVDWVEMVSAMREDGVDFSALDFTFSCVVQSLAPHN
jgi:hypothetical protein